MPPSEPLASVPVPDVVPPRLPDPATTHRDGTQPPRAADPGPAATTTGSHVRATYAQFAVNPETRDVQITIKDAATHQVLVELPSAEMQQLAKAMDDYLAAARQRAQQRTAAA